MNITARTVLARGLFLVALVAICTGCAAALPTGRFDALAAASKAVENKTRDTDADIVKLTRRFMVFVPADGPYTVTSFKPEIDGMDFDFGPRLTPRLAALDVLASYTEALAAFARKDYQGDLDRATQSLGGSVARLAGDATASAGAKKAAGILATAVNEIGRAYIERARRAELRKAMDKAQPGIDDIAQFVKEINRDAALAVETMRRGMITKVNALNASKPAEGVAKLQLSEAVEAVIVDTTVILAELKQESAAVGALGPAHAEVRDALDRDDRTSLEKLKAFVAEVKRLQGAFSSLK